MAYTATALSKEQQANGEYRVIVEFASDTPATEPSFRKELFITPSMTIQQGREWVYQQITNAKPKKSVADLIVLGAPITPLAPAAAAGPTAAQTWQAKAERLARFKSLGLTKAEAVADVTALEADVNATYVTGYANTL